MAINPLQQPINYAVEVQSPFEAAIGGIQLGTGLEELNLARQKRAMEAQQLQAAQAQQAQFQSSLNSFFANPNRKFEDLEPILPMANKQQFDALQAIGKNMGERRLESAKLFSGQLLAALESNPTIARSMLEQRIQVETNPQQRNAFQATLKLLDVSPTQAAQMVEYTGMGAFGKDWYDNVTKIRAERRTAAMQPDVARKTAADADAAVADAQKKVAEAAGTPDRLQAEQELRVAQAKKEAADARVAQATEATRISQGASEAEKARVEAQYAEGAAKDAIKKRAADLGLTTAQTNQALTTTRKLGLETQKAAVELAALKATGGRDPEKTFAQEEKIRKEWQGRSKMYGELQGTFNTLKASADSANGPGDIALITGFMKMLDPGSVVRETEFATARDTAGLFTQLQNRLEKAQNGQLLSPEQRKQYVALSQKYLDAAQTKAAQERKDLGIVVKNYNLNPQNVFGAETAPPQPALSAEQRRQQAIGQIPTTAVQQRNVTVDY